MKKTWFRLSLILLLTAVFLYFFFRSVSWKEVLRHLGDVNLPIFILSLILVPLHLVTRSWRWRLQLVGEKKDIPFSSLVRATTVGFAVNFVFPGRVGELVRPLYLAQKERIRKGFTLGTILVERIVDIFTNCFLLGFFLVLRPWIKNPLSVTSESKSNLYFYGVLSLGFALALLFIVLCLIFFRSRTMAVLSFLLRPFPQKFAQRVLVLIEDFIEGLSLFPSLRIFFLYVLLSFVVWLGIIFYYWVFFLAFRIEIAFLHLFPYVFLTMVGASIPTPGMVGGFHYFSRLALTALYGVDSNLAVGATIVVHALQVVVTAVLGYAILWKDGLTLIQLRKLGEQRSQ